MKQGLVPTGSKYTDADRRRAVVLYIVLGTDTAVAKELGCPRRTVGDWRRTDWWEQESTVVRHEIEDKLRATFRKVALEGTQLALEAIRSKELKGKEAMVTAGIAYDKLRLSENRPTSITGQSTGGIQSKLEEMADRMLELERLDEAKLVSEQPATEAEETDGS
jgi:hypothetical protein